MASWKIRFSLYMHQTLYFMGVILTIILKRPNICFDLLSVVSYSPVSQKNVTPYKAWCMYSNNDYDAFIRIAYAQERR